MLWIYDAQKLILKSVFEEKSAPKPANNYDSASIESNEPVLPQDSCVSIYLSKKIFQDAVPAKILKNDQFPEERYFFLNFTYAILI